MFSHYTTIESVKAKFIQLVQETGKVEQATAEAYLYQLETLDGTSTTDEEGYAHVYHFNREREWALVEKIQQLLALKMTGVDILLIGVWLWVKGETKPHKDSLGKGGVGMFWNGKRAMWYWRDPSMKSYRRSSNGIGSIASKYGYAFLQQEAA